MSYHFDLESQQVIKGKPYLIPYPKGLLLNENGEFLGEELFLIKENNQLAIVFLADEFKDSYEFKKTVVHIKNARVQIEKIPEKIILKEITNKESYAHLWSIGMCLLVVIFFYASKFLSMKLAEKRRLKKIRLAVEENNFGFILKNDAGEIQKLRSFLQKNLYKKEWESVHKLEYKNLKQEFLNV